MLGVMNLVFQKNDDRSDNKCSEQKKKLTIWINGFGRHQGSAGLKSKFVRLSIRLYIFSPAALVFYD
jgi:hypothetical protein